MDFSLYTLFNYKNIFINFRKGIILPLYQHERNLNYHLINRKYLFYLIRIVITMSNSYMYKQLLASLN